MSDDTLNFVFVSLQRILTDRDSTATNIARQLSKRHRVLYINAPIDKRTLYLRKPDRFTHEHIRVIRNRSEQNLIRVSDSMWVLNPRTVIDSINWIPHTGIFSYFNRRNNARIAAEYAATLEHIGFNQFILVNDKDIYRSFYFKELLKPLVHVYLDRDYIVGMGYWKRHGSKLEPQLMTKSDLVLCNSPGFTDRAKRYNPNSHYIGNGCDLALFDFTKDYECPDALASLRARPIIGYVGALLAMRLNIDLLAGLARAKPEWNIVLVGGEDGEFARSALHQLPNVHFLGRKDTREIPAYLRYFDVCINPQLVNDITKDNYPLKIDEYLAMGKPTVAIRTNVMEQVFSPQVRLATGSEDFVREIEAALATDDPGHVIGRIALARSHSWEAIAERVLGLVKRRLPVPESQS